MKKRVLSVLLAVCLLSTLVPIAAAISFSDMPNDYSTAALQAAIDNGLLNGSDGKILPNDYLTRAQMAAIVVRAFGASNEASLENYLDVSGDEWFAPYLAKAVHMKVLQGDGTRLMPNDPITRQQVFTILARALKLEDGTRADLAAFSDASSVADWAVGPVAAMVKAGFVHGAGGKLNPTANILRKDFAVVMHNIFKKYVTQPGTVTSLPEGSVLVNVPGVTLKDVTVKGDLVIGDGVGNGDVILENVAVTGRLVVRGGGLNSVIIRGSSSVGTVVVTKVDGNVRVYIEGDADVEVVYIEDGVDDVIVEGEVDKLVVSASDVPVTIKGTVDEVTVTGAKATITVDGEVGTLTTTSSATNTAVIVNDGANVEKVNANAAGTSVSGDGSVGSVNAAANNVNVSTVGTNVTAAPGVSGVKAGDKEVKPGETAKVEQGTTPGTGGGGGGGFPIGGGGAGEEPEPVASTYKFSYEVPADVVAGQEVVVPVTFETDGEPGDIGYDGVRFKFAAEGPEGATVTFKAVDSNNVEHSFTNEGYWGPPGGFDLPAQYSATTEWTLVFSEAGRYTITFSLIDTDSEKVIAGITDSVTIEIEEVTKYNIISNVLELTVEVQGE